MAQRVGAIEAGGTKIVCAVGSGPDDLEEIRFPTGEPESAITRICEFFDGHSGLESIGIGTFGPAGVHPDRPETYGRILNTPKPGWQDTDLVTPLADRFGVPIHFDTDVNVAALGEGKWGAAVGLHSFTYLTIGTGIGGGSVIDGKLVHGTLHPEVGHLMLGRDPLRDPFKGICPYHGDCFEGLASGPAIEARWSTPAVELPPDHEAWELEAHYISLALANLAYTLSPQQFILGGGVMEQEQLFPLIREQLATVINGYIAVPEVSPPGLGNRAGILGAVALAQR